MPFTIVHHRVNRNVEKENHADIMVCIGGGRRSINLIGETFLVFFFFIFFCWLCIYYWHAFDAGGYPIKSYGTYGRTIDILMQILIGWLVKRIFGVCFLFLFGKRRQIWQLWNFNSISFTQFVNTHLI